MQYSRKGWWISKTALWAVMLAGIALVIGLRPERPMTGLLFVAVFVICVPLGMRAFFYSDEIERQTRMRCWYFGCKIGVVITGLALVSMFFFGLPAPDAIINLFLHGRLQLPDAMFRVGVQTGFLCWRCHKSHVRF
jgi:hypothetical protein